MGVTTPWCARCGDWRGYMEKMCKGCAEIENMLLQLPCTVVDPKSKLTVSTPNATKEQRDALMQTRKELVAQRFTFISDKRTEREAYTQALEEMVDANVDNLKSIAYQWGNLRATSRQYRFDNIYAIEMTQVMELALTELGNVSLELSKFTQNTPVHEERMQRIAVWNEVMQKFLHPDASQQVVEQAAEGADDDPSDG